MTASESVTVVCTDRGQHPVRRIWVGYLSDPFIVGNLTVGGDPSPATLQSGAAERPAGGNTYTFPCRTCGREPQLRDEQLRRLLEGLIAAGETRVDISRLPF